jgi:hypothetical protein
MTRSAIDALERGESVYIDGATITRLPRVFACGRYRVDRPGSQPQMAQTAEEALTLVLRLSEAWTAWDLYGSFFALEWIGLYMIREYGDDPVYN